MVGLMLRGQQHYTGSSTSSGGRDSFLLADHCLTAEGTMKDNLLRALSPFHSVRARFSTAMGVLGLVFGLLLTVIIEWRIERDLRATAHDGLHAIASSIAHRLKEDLANRYGEVALMAHLLSKELLSPDSIGLVIDGLKSRQPIYAWIGLADGQGMVLAATDELLRGQNVKARPWFSAALQGGFVGDPHEAQLLAPHMKPTASGDPPRFLDVAAPLRNKDRRVIGVLGAHLYWDWVHSVVNAATDKLDRLGPVQVLIADQNGRWLIKPHQIVASDMSELMAADPHERYVIAREVVQPVASTSGLDWTVIVMEDINYAYAPIRESRNFMLLFATVLAASFAVLTWVVGGKVAQPIVRLARATRDQAVFARLAKEASQGEGTEETRALGQFMNRLAHYDSLTGLSNRKEVTGRIGFAMSRAASTQSHGALLLLNLDNFGVFNNVKSYEAGDQMLVAVAQRLRGLLDEGAALSRINGDEFVIVLENLDREPARAVAQAEAVAHKLLLSFDAPYVLDAGTFSTHASIGIYLIRPEPRRVSEAILYAELAMREAKRLGKHQIAVFNDEMQEQVAEQVKFEEDLTAGIPSQLVMLYQPQVDREGRVEGAEMLVRWRHPDRGLVSPALFIPLAEETGLIMPIGRWVMETACRQIRHWEGDPRRQHLVLAVNVSAREFASKDYVAQVDRILKETGVNPARLKLELTESALATDVEDVITKMHQLKQMGLTFSLDDFGTGFSSLSYLRRMPIDQLKIDQSFVRHLARDRDDWAIVRTVISLGENLGVQVIAEGVEERAQRELLEQLGCVHYQGFLYGKPMPLSEFENRV